MACLDFEWEHDPLLQIWKKIQDDEGNSYAMLETFTPEEAVSIFTQALSQNEVSFTFKNFFDVSFWYNYCDLRELG